MTTRVTFSNGEVSEYREGVDTPPSTGLPGVSVVHSEWLHPNEEIQETPGQKRDRLRAELDALETDEAVT